MPTIDHMSQLRQEYQAQYEQLTARINAIQKDLGRALDSEQKLILEQRLQDLTAERERVAEQLELLEQQTDDHRVASGSVPSKPAEAPIQIFLSYAREDFAPVSELSDRLAELGLKPWMDKRDILPGQRWRELIPQEVQRSDFVPICLSPRSVDKRGFFQREIRTALDAWQGKLREDIYLIPVRLEECEVGDELAKFNWVEDTQT